ncbi:1-phosphofructokinase family hexose kinase [Microvirga sp. 17 mud 1-3]|uniref:1-phosphofructokinase family hexose kinase n=1 Tax=Microvirga sp. 17 mud 1-3 TaxID=2082949 RepID=UPI000D6D8364|nr:1-phosphofructokinase family hexose kinase [Microvirga sp. 17 mud 1-3]AWM87096.1 1-phosphofructokinase [Microvirga sp. 17 mud 1-3]
MKRIVTLTLNPAIDGAEEAEQVRPIRKIRTWAERYDPGGGGINAARVIEELGGSALAIYLSGGTTGPILDALVQAAGIESRRIPIAGHTRISHTVHETSSGLEFRFVPGGPSVTREEWQACLAALEDIDGDYLLASGSLPRGVPNDFYGQVAALAARRGMRFVLDTSGDALRQAAGKGLFLIKPSLGELEDLVGRTLPTPQDQDSAVRDLIAAGTAEIIALTLGRDGAVLATGDTLLRIEGVKVTPKSAVGAGDSFLGAMTLGLAQGRPVEEAFTLGMAAGTAAVLTAGTELCRRADVERLYEEIRRGQTSAGA